MKFEQDGHVAVLYSPGFGAGWSSWAENNERHLLLFDPHIVQLVLDRDSGALSQAEFVEQVNMVFQLKNYQSYCSPEQLQVSWVPKGSLFRISS